MKLVCYVSIIPQFKKRFLDLSGEMILTGCKYERQSSLGWEGERRNMRSAVDMVCICMSTPPRQAWATAWKSRFRAWDRDGSWSISFRIVSITETIGVCEIIWLEHKNKKRTKNETP